MITYRKATQKDVRPALELALRVFQRFIAPDYEPEGAVNFQKDCIDNKGYIDSLSHGNNLMLVALDCEVVVGMIAERDNGEILLLFVDEQYHRLGVATALSEQMVCQLKLRGFDKITLSSSPYALPFYLNFGFLPTDCQQNHYGCIVTPMEYTPNEIWDILDANGDKTGRIIERGRPMATGEYHLAVHVWKHNGRGEWLIDKRASKKGGKWETTGGAAIAGDDSLTTALRETKEELGLNLDPAKGVLFRQFTKRVNNQHACLIDVWVFEHDCAIEDVHFQEHETCDAMWATAEQIRLLIKGNKFFSDVDLYFDEMVEKWERN